MTNTIRLPKKFRELCDAIRNGNEDAVASLEALQKYPHQAAAVKAEIAYFNQDYPRALELDLSILPYWDEWQYCNVANEHLAAMTVAALRLHREQEIGEILSQEHKRLLSTPEANRQRADYCAKMADCLQRQLLPFADSDTTAYQEPDAPKSLDELWENVMAIDRKSKPDSPLALSRYFHQCCIHGSAQDALSIFHRLPYPTEGNYYEAILRTRYLGDEETTLLLLEKLAASRLWYVASPTQVRPMTFFTKPVLCEYVTRPDSLQRIKKAGFLGENRA